MRDSLQEFDVVPLVKGGKPATNSPFHILRSPCPNVCVKGHPRVVIPGVPGFLVTRGIDFDSRQACRTTTEVKVAYKYVGEIYQLSG